MGGLLAEVCGDLPRPDAVVPMPLHPERLRKRGYNQCREMARPLARALDAPVRDDLLIRQRPTRPQTELKRRDRLRNLDGAFLGLPAAYGLHVLLADDTATTGTSLRRAAHALLDAGARGGPRQFAYARRPAPRGGLRLDLLDFPAPPCHTDAPFNHKYYWDEALFTATQPSAGAKPSPRLSLSRFFPEWLWTNCGPR